MRMLDLEKESTSLKKVEWDEETNQLFVTFQRTNERYVYSNVTQGIADGLWDAPSRGAYFYAVIKIQPDLHPYQKIGEDKT